MRALATAFLALGACACGHAIPYPSPHGPLYTGPATREPPGAAAAGGPLRLRIVTFNVEYALRVERAAAALRENERLRDADLVALQEMDAPGTAAISRALGSGYAYCPGSINPKYRRDVGTAIVSPWPIEEARKLALPHPSRFLGQVRVALRAFVTVAGRRFRVYSLHLGSPFGTWPGQRRDQIDVVLKDAEQSADPVIVAGDFNSHGLGERLVARGYAWLTRDVGPSTRGLSYDHVFVKGLRLTESRAGVAREVTDASDHRPVWVELAAER
ncbi:MAG TPA: endonuclease/exonuclease/phosphatase family protein [Vicinamibacteria bacterium]|nr:endonuclease/exonuclease/phosphatase family protein [Vicinamibacteria bacterium]